MATPQSASHCHIAALVHINFAFWHLALVVFDAGTAKTGQRHLAI
jgi:hypothetical protein